MSRIASAFKRLGKVNEAALIPYVIAGHPSLEATRQLVPVMTRQGADLVQIEIPSPPGDGATVAECLRVVAEARRANEIPLVLVCEYEIITEYGIAHFAAAASESGADGVLVPDLGTEDANDIKVACEEAGLDLVCQASVQQSDEQLRLVAASANGYVCCLPADDGGGLPDEPAPLYDLIRRLRMLTNTPLVANLTTATTEQVAQLAQFADGVVLTGAVMTAIEGLPEEDIILAAAEVVRDMKQATVR
jgi:tryptophan synthase alpha chain